MSGFEEIGVLYHVKFTFLFLIYINDIPNASSKLAFYLFADDTSIYFESETANKLALNVDKTNFVIFHSPQKPLCENIIIKFGKQHVGQIP